MKTKKNRFNNILKFGVFLFGIMLLLWNCDTEEIPIPEKKVIQIIKFKQIDDKLKVLIPEVKTQNTLKQKNNTSNTNVIFNFNEVIKLVDSLKNTRFTIEFTVRNQPKNIFYNLVIGEDKEGVIINPVIYKYTVNNYSEFKENLKAGRFLLKGERELFDYESFKNNFNNSKSNAKTSTEPCNKEEINIDSTGGDDDTYWWDEWVEPTEDAHWTWEFNDEGDFDFPSNSKTTTCSNGGNGATAVSFDLDRCPTGYMKDPDTKECVKVETVFNNLTDPCAKELFEELLSGIFADDPLKPEVKISSNAILNFSEVILKMFNNSDIIHFTIQNEALANSNASTIGANITISDSYLQNATQLSIARTMIHESVHAYLNALYSNNVYFNSYTFSQKMDKYAKDNGFVINSNLFHHNFMAQFINAMALSLYEWDKEYGAGGNLGWDYYRSMAFSGQFQTDNNGNIISETDSFKEIEPDINKRKEIAKVVFNELKGNNDAKGTKCD